MFQDIFSEFCDRGMITPERMRAVDRNAISLGVPGIVLMESAGTALARMAVGYNPGRVLVLCGRGNNGGDGLVAARHLQGCDAVDIISPAEGMRSPESTANLALLSHCAVNLHPVGCPADVEALLGLFSEADLIIDAMLGTGVSGQAREPFATAVRLTNMSSAPVLAADVPTPGMRADRICTFHRPKMEGSEVIDIGIPLEAECCTGPGDLTLLRQKGPDAHKGAGGEVLVIGGGPYQGAPYLAALAALRGGADIVRVATPNLLQYPDLIIERLEGNRISEEHTERLISLAEHADVVVCGCGLGRESQGVVSAIAPHCGRAVFDADALTLPFPLAEESICTPHTGEFRRLFGNSLPSEIRERAHAVRACAQDTTLLVKGAVDIISDGERVRFNRTGTPAMTVGGTGDVLAGLTGALFCRLPAFEAACAAAYANGRAGETASAGRGHGLAASDLLDILPAILYRE